MPPLAVPALRLPGPDSAGITLARLGRPPRADTERAQRDLRISHELEVQRTLDGDHWARVLDLRGATKVWADLATRVRGEHGGVADALVAAALRAGSAASGAGKRQWKRLRPFEVDPTITVVGRTPKDGDSSYPSSHATRAYAAARVLSQLDPSLAADAYAMAREVALSRVYAGVHFVSDVVAGAQLGTAVGVSVLDRWRAGALDRARGSAAA